MMYGNHMTSGWLALAILGEVIVWGLIIFALYGSIAEFRGRRTTRRSPAAPSEVLERRLAAGEIRQAEYEQLRAALAAPPSQCDQHRRRAIPTNRQRQPHRREPGGTT
jgi:uncharacterized membrane protein